MRVDQVGRWEGGLHECNSIDSICIRSSTLRLSQESTSNHRHVFILVSFGISPPEFCNLCWLKKNCPKRWLPTNARMQRRHIDQKMVPSTK